jgi:hypothetical protein
VLGRCISAGDSKCRLVGNRVFGLGCRALDDKKSRAALLPSNNCRPTRSGEGSPINLVDADAVPDAALANVLPIKEPNRQVRSSQHTLE